MKDKNLFDMLENAEDDTMEKLTENCPEISDAKLEELLAETERRYTMKKKEIGKIRENTNTMNNEDSVSGVDHVKRPSWLRPLALAASFVLIAGTVVGSVALMKNAKPEKNNKSQATQTEPTSTTQDTTQDIKVEEKIDQDYIIALTQNFTDNFDRLYVKYTKDLSDNLSEYDINRIEFEVQFDKQNAFKWEKTAFITGNKTGSLETNYNYVYDYAGRSLHVSPDINTCDLYHDKTPLESDLFSYLLGADSLKSDTKDKWSITGYDTVCGKECAVVEIKESHLSVKIFIDIKTGVIMKEIDDGDATKENMHNEYEVTEIRYDDEAGDFVTPPEFKKFLEDGNYNIDYYGNDPHEPADLDLSFLDEPPVQQTEAPSVEETASAETTDVTTQTTTEAVSEATVATQYTIPEFTAPEPENMLFNDELGKLALEMCKKEEIEYTLIVAEGGVQTDNSDYVMFSVDPKLEYSGYDPTKNEYSGGEPNNKVYYVRVNDSHFSDFEGFKKYARGLYSENNYKYKRLLESYADGFDDLEQGEMIAEKDMRYYIGYRGKLYKLFHIAGKGYLERRYDEEYPVIIADKTETSFRAIIPFDREYTQEGVDKVAEDKVNFVEVKFVLDTENGNWTKESNDWRVESVNEYYEDGVYKALADQIRAK